MAGALDGIKVLEAGAFFQTPSAACVLGDLGADVVKIESRQGGDPGRGWIDLMRPAGQRVERNYLFEFCNRNKRSIALDLQHAEGREIIYRLVRESDVFMHGFRAETVERLGLTYETLYPYNPRLIYAEASGFGSKGPSAGKPGFENAAMAMAGVLYEVGEPDMPPQRFVSGIGDETGATMLVQAILAALFARERTGVGQKVETSLLGSLVALTKCPLSSVLMAGVEFPRRLRSKTGNALYNHYQCGDGKWIVLCMVQADKYWSTFCKVMKIEELEKDPRFSDMTARSQNAEAMVSILDDLFATKTRDEWLKIMETEDLIYGGVQTPTEASIDTQILQNDYIVEWEHPTYGPGRVVGFPWKFSETPPSLRRRVPELGEHTEKILLEVGYGWEDIARLKAREIIL